MVQSGSVSGSNRIEDRVKEALAGFTGRLPLFPLPRVVQFPMTVLPLHIFEPRYRAMTKHAVEGEKLIGMALLLPGYEPEYYGRPAIHDVICLGRLIHVEEKEDGTYDIMLEGLARARILSEVPGGEFRQADVAVLEDVRLGPDDEGLWRQRLDMLMVQLAPEIGTPIRKTLGTLMSSHLPLGTLLDLLAHALPAPAEDRQRVLAAADVQERAKLMLELLTRHHRGADDAPKQAD